ncbi:MAG: hypothetical protein US49_C0001G0079 [candidate division TM6 bacterium GW2011_GWF2_37_49]|nr:MAG: hypothetical protein US49_C0001G0079 [candidate division TM6 bacterium GW2011_GWF2_37_49]
MKIRFRHFLFFCWLVSLCFNVTVQAKQEYGLAIIDSIMNQTPFPISLYSTARPLSSKVGDDGSVVRIKSLSTGKYYRVEKDVNGIWRLYANGKDARDVATQFTISHQRDKYIAFYSEVAEGFYLQSDPKTFEVFLKKEIGDNALWDLVEDINCGDTLNTVYIRNVATGGCLISSVDTSAADVADDSSKAAILNAEIKILERQIEITERVNPPLTITYAKITNGFKWFKSDEDFDFDNNMGLTDIKEKLIPLIKGNVLHVEGFNWLKDMAGASYTVPGRAIRIKYTEYLTDEEKQKGINNEKEIRIHEGKLGKPDETLHIVADVSRHPIVPLIIALQNKKIEFDRLRPKLKKTEEIQKIILSEIGKTGYDGKPSIINQASKNAIEVIVYIPNESGGGAPQETSAGFSALKSSVWAHDNPEIIGHGRYKIDNFGPEMVVTINPLYSKGFAWIDESLPIPGQGTVIFEAFSPEGDVQVCFSDEIAPQSIYKIAFGAAENTKTIIYKNGEVVQSVNNEQNINARIMPDMIEQLWVSYDKGFIVLGKGSPGTNIIMSWRDPKPASGNLNVGFCTHESTTKIKNIQKVASSIVVMPPQRIYVKDTKNIQVGTSDAPAWHSLPLSPTDSGTVAFEAKGSEEAILFLGNSNNEGYKITFGAEQNSATLVERINGGQDLYRIDAGMLPIAALKTNEVNKYWVGIYKGLVVIGNGDVGKNTFCVFVDSSSPKGIFKIGFGGKASIQNLEIWPEIQFVFSKDGSAYKTPSLTSLTIISPYDYKIMQDGPAVRFRDVLTGTLFQTNGTPEPGASYHIKMNVLESGLPNVTHLYQDQSKERKDLEKCVKALEITGETIFKAAASLAQATNLEVYSSLGVIAATGAVAILAAAFKIGQQAMQSKIDEYETESKRYVFREDIQRMVGGSGQVSSETLRNRQIFEAKLGVVLPLQLSDPVQLDYGIKQWADAMRLITDFYIVGDSTVKAKICDGLETLFNSVVNLEITPYTVILLQTVLSTFIEAYNNPYLTGAGNAEDEAIRDKWYGLISNISAKLITSPSVNQNGMPIKFKGEYFWFPVKFPSPASGSVTFQVKAAQDIFVALGEGPYKVRNLNSRIYEIVFGKWNNKVTAIHRKSLGDAVVEFDQKKLPDLSPDPTTFKEYWINVDEGIISCGVGKLGQNKQFEWKDPYPMPPVTCVGFSNWNREILIKDVEVRDSISTILKRRATDVSVKKPKEVPQPNVVIPTKKASDKPTHAVRQVVPTIPAVKPQAVPAVA